MKTKKVFDHIKLDDFNIEIPFSISKNALIDLFEEKNIPVDTTAVGSVVVKSCMFSLEICFFIYFGFHDERLTSVTMSPVEHLENSAWYLRYKQIQKALMNEWGKPCNHWPSILNLLYPDDQSARWKCDKVKIEHYIRDRFGMEEAIEIKFMDRF